MFSTGDKAKLELILKYINDIKGIVKNHGTEELTISNIEGEYAVMMCIIQMGEAVNKITEQKIKDKLPVSKIIGMRNKIVHGYEEVDRKMIIEVLKNIISKLVEVYHPKLIYLFGSYAWGEPNKDSDLSIDLLIYTDSEYKHYLQYKINTQGIKIYEAA